MNDLQKEVLRSIFQASSEGLRLWQVQKKVDGTKLEVQEALHELLAAGYIGILSMGGGPKTPDTVKKLHFRWNPENNVMMP